MGGEGIEHQVVREVVGLDGGLQVRGGIRCSGHGAAADDVWWVAVVAWSGGEVGGFGGSGGCLLEGGFWIWGEFFASK